MSWFVKDDVMHRQGYVCPECSCVKDGYDVDTQKWVQTRWCWNVRGHEHPGRRKMRPTCIRYEVAPDATAPSSTRGQQ